MGYGLGDFRVRVRIMVRVRVGVTFFGDFNHDTNPNTFPPPPWCFVGEVLVA